MQKPKAIILKSISIVKTTWKIRSKREESEIYYRVKRNFTNGSSGESLSM